MPIADPFVRVAGADPAANTEITESVPAGETWRLVCVTVALVQGATQTPQPILIVDDGTNVVYEALGSSAAQAVSTTCQYNWAPGLAISGQVGSGSNVHAFAPLPAGLVLSAGWRVRTSTIGIGANSNYGVPSLLVAKY